MRWWWWWWWLGKNHLRLFPFFSSLLSLFFAFHWLHGDEYMHLGSFKKHTNYICIQNSIFYFAVLLPLTLSLFSGLFVHPKRKREKLRSEKKNGFRLKRWGSRLHTWLIQGKNYGHSCRPGQKAVSPCRGRKRALWARGNSTREKEHIKMKSKIVPQKLIRPRSSICFDKSKCILTHLIEYVQKNCYAYQNWKLYWVSTFFKGNLKVSHITVP